MRQKKAKATVIKDHTRSALCINGLPSQILSVFSHHFSELVIRGKTFLSLCALWRTSLKHTDAVESLHSK